MDGSIPVSATNEPAAVAQSETPSLVQEAWRRFRRHKLAVAGAIILVLLVLAVLFGPLIWRVPMNEVDFTQHLGAPSPAHPLGSDDLGQDLLARMLYGGRISLAVGLAAMLVGVIIGTIVGAIAGISRRVIDGGLMWVTDLFLSLPHYRCCFW
jgi:peptide/nickel transport system permease protein